MPFVAAKFGCRVEAETQDQDARNMLMWSFPIADVGGADPGEVRCVCPASPVTWWQCS